MKLGAVEYHFRGADDTAKFLLAKRLGLEGVEVMLTHEQLMDPAEERLASLKRAQANSRLEVPSLMLADHDLERGIGRRESVLVEEAMADVRSAIDWAVELGSGVILVPFFETAEIMTKDDLERAAQGFRALCPLAASKGVHLCYEGTLSADDTLRLAELVGSEAFGCYFDTGNMAFLGMDPATEIRAVGNLIKQVHFKDVRVFPGDCRLGQGLVDFGETTAALREIGYDGWIVGEFTEYPDDPDLPPPPPEVVAHDVSFTWFWFPELKRPEPWPQVGATSSYFKRGELAHMIECFKRYGLRAVQLGGALLDEALKDPSAIPDIRDRLEANGITVAGLDGSRNLVARDADRRRANIDFLKRCLEVAPLFGTSLVRTGTGTRHPKSDELPSPDNLGGDAWELLCAALDELFPVAERHGSILAIAGDVNHVVRTGAQLMGLIDQYATKHLRIVLDPYLYLSKHLIPARQRVVAAFLDRFEHLFVLAYLKDVGREGAEAGLVAFGQGVFPQNVYLDFLRTRRPDLPIILEDLPFDHIPAAMRRLQDYIDYIEDESY